MSKSSLTIDQILAIRSYVMPDPPQWSADGQRLTFVSSLGGEVDLWSISAEGGFPQRQTTGMGAVRFLSNFLPRRSPDGKWIAYMSEQTGAAELYVWPTDGGEARQLTRLGNNINALSWSPDSQTIAFSCNRYGSFDIYRVELADGRTTRLTSDALYEVYPTFTPDGKNIVYVRMDERWADHEVLVMPASGGAGRVIASDTDYFDYHYGRTFGYPLIAPDGQSLLFRSHRSGWMNYWRVGLSGGEPTPLCAEASDQSEATWSPDGQWVAYNSNHNGTIELRIVSADGKTKRTLVAPGMGTCAAPQWSPDSSRLAYFAQTPTMPSELCMVNVQTGTTKQLTNGMIGGNVAQQLIKPQKIAYPSFDGLSINAYLYAPPQRAAGEKFPCIVWVHGGPTSQWSDLYYNYMQYFAMQGYVVLAPNIRGSSGYGKAFEDANNGDWGHGDLKDVIAGVDYLKTLDYVNPHKMGITGTSYGGCMSMSAVGFAPGVFQAAIPMSGYADWVAMYHEQELRHVKLLEYEFGPFETHQHVYKHCSPYYHVKQATTPCFVIHGEGRLPRSSASLDFVKALEKEYKTVQYKAYQGEGYYVQSPKNVRQMWLDMGEWFKKFLKD